MICCVVAPVDQVLPVAAEEVSTTDPPEQKVVAPPAEIVGVAGRGFTVTTVATEVADVQLPLVTETVYEPEVVTVIACVVSPVDQTFPLAAEDVSVTDPPEQNVVGPPAVIVGVAATVPTVTTTGEEVIVGQPATVFETV